MSRYSCATSAAIGAFLICCLPHLQPRFSGQAAWCWPAQPPKCLAPVVTGGSCAEGATLTAGQTCTPQCSGGQTPSGSCTVLCPPSGGAGCINDANANTWWVPCGFGNRCQQDIQLGTPQWAQFGTFSCVSGGAAAACTVVTLPPTIDLMKDWGLATGLFVGGLALITFFGIICGLLPACVAVPYYVPELWPLCRKRKGGLSIASLSAISLVTIGVIVYLIALLSQNSDLLQEVHKLKITGLAAGIAVCLPMWFGFNKAGIHDLFGLSREVAWRVHVVLGWLAIIFGGVHGVWVWSSSKKMTDSIWWTFGAIGWLLMLIGVLPSDLHIFMPSLLSYDAFKLIHILTFWGFLFVVLHMGDHVVNAKSTEAWIVFLLNAVVGVWWLVSKILLVKVKGACKKATVKSVEVSDEECGKHIFLQLSMSSFPFKAGQWGHLLVPKVGLVPHPFTIVPLEDDSTNGASGVQFFIKVSGKYTQKLAEACAGGATPKITVEGPYGIPAIPDPATNAAVFVLGGVGVTPALSLVSEALRTYSRNNVHLYWTCRSQKLLARCEPFLKGVRSERRHICLSGAQPSDGELPLGAQAAKINIADWMETAGRGLRGAGKEVTLFCCGPEGLCNAAVKHALSCQGAMEGLCWHVHVEEFRFLPSMSGSGSQRTRKVQAESVGKGMSK